jgi:SAM-dependent methyltransferase
VKRVDYDTVAPTFDRRYAGQSYDQTEHALTEFLGTARQSVLEVGCGTGHWLKVAHASAALLVGVDRSLEMLRRARLTVPSALLVHATAEHLPIQSRSCDRVFCINALHHFPDQRGFIEECRRVLQRGGAFLTVGLDPHSGSDRWWVYDYFPSALEADRERYPSTQRIRELLLTAGFTSIRSAVVQHWPAARPFDAAVTAGLLERNSTSQLMVISDAAYRDGRRRLEAERPILRADLRLFGTWAELPR